MKAGADSKECLWASRMFYALAIGVGVHMLGLFFICPLDGIDGMSIFAAVYSQVFLAGLLVWIGMGIRRRRRFSGGFAVLLFIGLAIGTGVALAITGGYPIRSLLAVVHGFYIVAWLTCCVTLVRAWATSQPHV